MIRILTSSFRNYEKTNDEIIIHPIDNSNDIVDQINNNLVNHKKMVFVASDINNTREKILDYANILFDSMKMAGISFDEYLILDGESKEKASVYIEGASLIFLCGGEPYSQHEFFNTINLKEILKDYHGIVIGQSAGALNMAENVFNSPESPEDSEPIFFDGLALTNINIEPHFVYDTSNFDDDEEYQRNVVIKESYNRPIYGQCNGSHVFIDDNNVATVYGETYLINKGNIECICKNGSKALIKFPLN